MSAKRILVLGAAMLAAEAGGLVPPMFGAWPVGLPPIEAQNIGQRVVEGKVLDSNSAVVSGATVFLKNLKTKTIRSYTSREDGKFRFTQVNMADDHEIWAEKEAKRSAIKTVSSWDSRADYECELKLK